MKGGCIHVAVGCRWPPTGKERTRQPDLRTGDRHKKKSAERNQDRAQTKVARAVYICVKVIVKSLC